MTEFKKDHPDFNGIRLCTMALDKSSEAPVFAASLKVEDKIVTGTDGHRITRYMMRKKTLKDGSYTVATNNQKKIVLHKWKGQAFRYSSKEQVDAVLGNDPTYRLNVNRKDLLNAFRKMAILKDRLYSGVKLFFSNGKLRMHMVNPDIGDAETSIDTDYDGEDLEIGLNVAYCIDMARLMKSPIIEIGVIDESSPVFFKGEEDQGFIGLIMTMIL